MKRFFTILLAIALLLSLAACRKDPPGPTPPIETTGEIRTEPIQALPAMADLLANWAWGTSNGRGEEPAATHLAVTSYPEGCDFTKLDLAVGPFGQAKVRYAGEKQGDDSIEPWYFANYDRITGPYFAFERPVAAVGWDPLILLDSSVLGEGLAALRSEYDQNERSYPPASDQDISKADFLKNGRKVEESQLLATAGAARVCMFRYENLEGGGLFTIAYIDGDTFLAYDVTTDYVEEDGVYWRVDLEPDNVGFLQPVLLCNTREGILLLVAWSAPEGMAELILREAHGALEGFSLDGYFYDPWGNEFYLIYEED